MPISGVLFNPMGRTGPNDFWRGIIVLVGFIIVSNVLQLFAPVPIPQMLALLFYLLPYPYLCVFGKRLHDSGRSAWWFVPIFFAFLATLTAAVVTLPGWTEVARAMSDPNVVSDQRAINELVQETFGGARAAIHSFAALFGFNLISGVIVARLPSDPELNQHGLPTVNGGSPFS
ncbi:MAG: DUF805 domain-containing protein [Pseudomonadota bacterium]